MRERLPPRATSKRLELLFCAAFGVFNVNNEGYGFSCNGRDVYLLAD
jgi:hypothetical protein